MDTSTEKHIIDAFIELYIETPFEEITVQDICRQAAVSKSTFYYYFESKNEIKTYIESYVKDKRISTFSLWPYINLEQIPDSKPEPMTFDVLKFVDENKKLFRALFGEYGDKEFVSTYHQIIIDMCYEKLEEKYPERAGNYFLSEIFESIISKSTEQLYSCEVETLTFNEVAIFQTRMSKMVLNFDFDN